MFSQGLATFCGGAAGDPAALCRRGRRRRGSASCFHSRGDEARRCQGSCQFSDGERDVAVRDSDWKTVYRRSIYLAAAAARWACFRNFHRGKTMTSSASRRPQRHTQPTTRPGMACKGLVLCRGEAASDSHHPLDRCASPLEGAVAVLEGLHRHSLRRPAHTGGLWGRPE